MLENNVIALYDDHCSLCTIFAQWVKRMTKNKVQLVGHYSPQGSMLRKDILESDALEMFWVIDKDTAYGGRAAIWPLLKIAISTKKDKTEHSKQKYIKDTINTKKRCTVSDCSGAKHVFIRSASLIRNSRIIQIH